MVVGVLALIIATAGTSYAAIKLPANSVGTKQLEANAVTSGKVKNGSLLAGDFKAGQLPAGARGAQGTQGPQGQQGAPGRDGSDGADGVALAGAIVDTTSAPDPSFWGGKHFGFTNVQRAGTGQYCLTLASELQPSLWFELVVSASPVGITSAVPPPAFAYYVLGAGCGPGQMGVMTTDGAGNASNAVSFAVIVT
jgi:hypothetical protein